MLAQSQNQRVHSFAGTSLMASTRMVATFFCLQMSSALSSYDDSIAGVLVLATCPDSDSCYFTPHVLFTLLVVSVAALTLRR